MEQDFQPGGILTDLGENSINSKILNQDFTRSRLVEDLVPSRLNPA
jgi:hypothetical protein